MIWLVFLALYLGGPVLAQSGTVDLTPVTDAISSSTQVVSNGLQVVADRELGLYSMLGLLVVWAVASAIGRRGPVRRVDL